MQIEFVAERKVALTFEWIGCESHSPHRQCNFLFGDPIIQWPKSSARYSPQCLKWAHSGLWVGRTEREGCTPKGPSQKAVAMARLGHETLTALARLRGRDETCKVRLKRG